MFDVIVVGAGPAGSTVARKLALLGHRILLLDKSTFPRYKVCGGGLTGRAKGQLDVDVADICRDAVDTMELSVNGRLRRRFRWQTPIIHMVMRDEFDHRLLQKAIEAGVTFYGGVRVHEIQLSNRSDERSASSGDWTTPSASVEQAPIRVETSAGAFHGHWLIGADGVQSTVAKAAGLMQDKQKILALEYEMNVSSDTLERYRGTVAIDYGFIRGGYAWVFPKGDHLSVGVGLGTDDGRFLQSKLMEYLNREGIRGTFSSEKGFWLSVGASDTGITQGRVALVGDAAGLVDPFMGEGIYYALRSANLLAEHFQTGIAAHPDAPFAQYQTQVDDELVHEMRLFKRASSLFYTMPGWFHALLVVRPQMVHSAFRVVAGTLDFPAYYAAYRRKPLVKFMSGIARRMLS